MNPESTLSERELAQFKIWKEKEDKAFETAIVSIPETLQVLATMLEPKKIQFNEMRETFAESIFSKGENGKPVFKDLTGREEDIKRTAFLAAELKDTTIAFNDLKKRFETLQNEHKTETELFQQQLQQYQTKKSHLDVPRTKDTEPIDLNGLRAINQAAELGKKQSEALEKWHQHQEAQGQKQQKINPGQKRLFEEMVKTFE